MALTFDVHLLKLAVALLTIPTLAGCNSVLSATTADLAGVGSAAISSGVTKNAALGTGIGLAVAAAADAGLQYVERDVHRAEQEQIAAAAGPLAPGAVASWRVAHRIPIENDEHGRVTVFRVLATAAFTCKEVVFSTENGQGRTDAFYTTTICFDGTRWQWAEAEPATSRWGSLQ
ncbi:MAG TPA: hypothetical protein VFW75_16150 [Acetobacteraceae bacterium]|nr:hypothetical protein [Acetobacteraceae bacterium]